MKIVMISPNYDTRAWEDALWNENPDLEIEVYPEDTDRENTDFVLAWNPPKDVFDKYPNLKVVASMGAGIRHITKNKSLNAEVIVTKIEDEQLIEDLQYFVLTSVLNYCRNIPQYVLQQQQKNWNRVAYKQPKETRIGVLGLGNIGLPVAQILAKNNFKVSGWSNSEKEIESINTFAGEDGLSAFLKDLDVVVCLLPLTDDTEDILNEDLFSKMPKGAYLINVGRGAHLNESDLLEALETEQLSGAALDVFQDEPLPKDHPFWENEKITITPHTASVTNPASVANQITENYLRLKEGKELKHIISRKKGY
ncbi:glyoxylate/hydroxypyruvate reductase A [Mesonia ostreae]|uniref:Glyoxylate/hydroxypyruvate reductase A n=1 Tax=Mesonia ostreae TaxID=861110 RepID=A0ABU2KFC0_9FLAO|nr:glyoxylate/hydroxypyruvate reductase A [Mesonia ostreae]MDT0293401.1 glyoxylate/hydroxypyruvate reductase A [Mesonia ostreae]